MNHLILLFFHLNRYNVGGGGGRNFLTYIENEKQNKIVT